MPYFVEKFYKFFPQLAFATAPWGGSNPLDFKFRRCAIISTLPRQ